MTSRLLLVLLAAWLLSACGASAPISPTAPPTVAAAGTPILPPLSELPSRGASAAVSLPGSAVIAQQGCGTNAGLAFLSPSIGTKTDPWPFAFAVYRFEGVTTAPPAVIVKTAEFDQTKLWVAIGDWSRGAWDFRPGWFFSNPGFALEELGGDPQRFVSPEGSVVVALLVLTDEQVVEVRELQLAIPTEPTGLTATEDRWEGVRLSWNASPVADGYNLYRRVAGSGGNWTLLNNSPINRFDTVYDDLTALHDLRYEYWLRAGELFTVRGVPQLLWSKGLHVEGARRASVLDVEAGPIAGLRPVNLHNYLSFFYNTAEAGDEVNTARATTYPPEGDWEVLHAGEEGFGEFDLREQAGLPRPFAANQAESVNNPLVTIAYSNAAGSFSQVGTVEPDGATVWEDPVQLRTEPQTHMLGLLDVPRHLIAFFWNDEAEMIEAMETVDSVGRIWQPFEPDTWMSVSAKRPAGEVDFVTLGGQVILSFREAGTGLATLVRNNAAGWNEISPGFAVRDQLFMREARRGLIPGSALFYVAEDGAEIRKLHRESDVWVSDTALVTTTAAGGVTEMELQAQSGVSVDHYLAYIVDGQVWFVHGDEPGFEIWTSPLLVDGTGVCSDLKIITVGTDETFSTNYVFATYLKDDGDGVPRINFRDMKVLYHEHVGE